MLCGHMDHPWICIGDFNETLQANEQEGGNPKSTRQMERFHDIMEKCRFNDLGYSGNKYTWFTTKGGGIKVQLDGALATQGWIDLFPHFRLQHLNKTYSDHVSVLLTWEGNKLQRGRKQFHYEEAWNMLDDYPEVVRNGWEVNVDGSLIYQVNEKIKATRMMLSNWPRSKVRIGPQEIREVEDKFISFLGQPFTEELIEQKKALNERLIFLLEQEETFWCQRAKEN